MHIIGHFLRIILKKREPKLKVLDSKNNKLGLSCAKLRASFDLLGFDSVWSVWYSRFGLVVFEGLIWYV